MLGLWGFKIMAEYKLPDEAKTDKSRNDDLDELIGRDHPVGIDALGQNYVLPKGAGRLDESTQRGAPLFQSPYRPDRLEIPQSSDKRAIFPRHGDIFDPESSQARSRHNIKARGMHIINRCIVT
jgi:hypothetical protein